ncbi:kinase-like domain-containing protein [Coprinopsis sp. MPI-PUGE-AT-0042]|nr:kinase-like domain-containing protein [Coprinopsis sp. MPI-PUGE-AT-0042]
MRANPYFQAPEIEDYLGYRPGGYHPVYLGDAFNNGRYTVVNKLGHGSFSTVWLVRDEAQGSLASLKIITADASKYTSGTELDVFRRSAACSGEGKRFILQFLDSFFHEGPNGKHLCVVTEVSGPPLATNLLAYGPEGVEDLEPEFAGTFVWQLVQGLEYLHSCGIVHGDLHLGNILYHLPGLSTLKSPDDIEKYFGAPTTLAITLRKGRSSLFNVPHLPRFVVYPAHYTHFYEQLFADPSLAELRICDFSESSLFDPATLVPHGTKRKLNCPDTHLAPEVIFDDLVSPASDIWALGNSMHQIMDGGGTEGRSAIEGESECSMDEILCRMVHAFGSKLPDRWWNAWEKRTEYFDDQGQWVVDPGMFRPRQLLLGRGMYRPSFFPGGTKEAFVEVLRRIFVYEPVERLTAAELVKELGWLKDL